MLKYLFCAVPRLHYPTANDFGSEVIPKAVKDYNVQVNAEYINVLGETTPKLKLQKKIVNELHLIERFFFRKEAKCYLNTLIVISL